MKKKNIRREKKPKKERKNIIHLVISFFLVAFLSELFFVDVSFYSVYHCFPSYLPKKATANCWDICMCAAALLLYLFFFSFCIYKSCMWKEKESKGVLLDQIHTYLRPSKEKSASLTLLCTIWFCYKA